jgi:ketol-acid reductoisomerase
VILVAPKGSGRTVRSLFKEGRGINSSVAVYQDVTGKALEKAVAMGVAVGSGYLYQTTFEKEVWSDLYGERGCLMGGIHGMFLAQYEVLRENGHTPSEAFNETVEEATQSLYPLIGANGMDYMYEACSTTARRGALDWSKRFKANLKPLFEELYESTRNGTETQRTLDYACRLPRGLREGDTGDPRHGDLARRQGRPLPPPREPVNLTLLVGCSQQHSSETLIPSLEWRHEEEVGNHYKDKRRQRYSANNRSHCPR